MVQKELKSIFEQYNLSSLEVKIIESKLYIMGMVLMPKDLVFVDKVIGEKSDRIVNLVSLNSEDYNKEIAKAIKAILPDILGDRISSKLETTSIQKNVIVKGTVDDAKTLERTDKILKSISENIINLISTRDDGPVVQIKAYIMQVDRSRTRNFGVRLLQDRLVLNQHGTTPEIAFKAGSRQQANNDGDLQDVSAGGLNFNWFFSASLDNKSVFELMENYGLGRLLASPSLICKNGEKAYFHHGDTIPIQSVGEDGTYSVTYKDTGIKLSMEPNIIGDQIDMKITAEISTIGQYKGSGLNPIINEKKVENHFTVKEGETITLSGLSERTKVKTINKTPFFGDLPIAGHFFRSTKIEVRDYDFAIFVTPYIVTGASEENKKMRTKVENEHNKEAKRSPIFYGLDRDVDNSYNEITPDKEDFTGMNPYYDFDSKGEEIELP